MGQEAGDSTLGVFQVRAAVRVLLGRQKWENSVI